MELTRDQELFLAAVVKRFPRYGTDLFSKRDVHPSTVRPGLTDEDCDRLIDELTTSGRLKNNSGNYSFADGSRDIGHRALEKIENRRRWESWLMPTTSGTVSGIIGGVVSGLLVALVLSSCSHPPAGAPAPTTQR
jgi:prepilin-type processing-associated H-X9-DG protein